MTAGTAWRGGPQSSGNHTTVLGCAQTASGRWKWVTSLWSHITFVARSCPGREAGIPMGAAFGPEEGPVPTGLAGPSHGRVSAPGPPAPLRSSKFSPQPLRSDVSRDVSSGLRAPRFPAARVPV